MKYAWTFLFLPACGVANAAGFVDELPPRPTAKAGHCCDELPPPASAKPTYEELRAKAIAEDKPLIAWVGGGDANCPACVNKLSGEAIHFITPWFPDTPSQALVVMIPDKGELWRAATVTQWVTGDGVWGHVPSIRRAIARWRDRRSGVKSGWSMTESGSMSMSYAPAVAMSSAVFAQPMMGMSYGMGMMGMGYGGSMHRPAMAMRSGPIRRIFRGAGGCAGGG